MATFIEDKKQKLFEEEGYVLVDSFLSKEEIAQLRAFYFKLDNDLGDGFHATMHSHLIEYRRKVSQGIANVFVPKTQRLLNEYRPLVANFTVKEPGTASFFDFHLDWNMVDETKYRSITIWTPLVDTNEQNGNLWILEKSHLLGNSYRCGPGLALYFENTNEFKDIKLKKKALPMKAGDAIIYDHKLFHGSPPNLTNEPRLAINQAMAPISAPSLHYQERKKKRIVVYQVEDDFYNSCIIGEKSVSGKKITSLKMKSAPVDQKVVNQIIYK